MSQYWTRKLRLGCDATDCTAWAYEDHRPVQDLNPLNTDLDGADNSSRVGFERTRHHLLTQAPLRSQQVVGEMWGWWPVAQDACATDVSL